MKPRGAAPTGACVVLLLLCLALPPAGAGEREERILQVYSWVDYFDSGVISAFQTQYNCRVALSYFSSNEELHEVLEAGEGGFDIMTPSSYMASILWREGKLLPIQHGKIPNASFIDRSFVRYTEDPEMEYSIPYTRSVSGVGYLKDRVLAEDLGTWFLFANPRYRGKLTMLRDMREVMGAALKYLGHSLNTVDDDQLMEAELVVESWKRNAVEFIDDQTRLGLQTRDAVASMSYNSDVLLEMEDDPGIGYFSPEEGASLVADEFVIPADAVNVDLAHAFINHILEPENAAKTMEGIYYVLPVPDAFALLDEDLRNNQAFLLPETIVNNSEVIRDLGDGNAKYVAIWKRLMDGE